MAGVVAQGSFSFVQVSMKGVDQRRSSSMVERTLTNQSMPSGRVNIQLMQKGQKKCRVAPRRPPTTGSPSVTANPSLGIAALKEKALAVIRWQPVQWQAMVRIGFRVILSRVRPQRHAHSLMEF